MKAKEQSKNLLLNPSWDLNVTLHNSVQWQYVIRDSYVQLHSSWFCVEIEHLSTAIPIPQGNVSLWVA